MSKLSEAINCTGEQIILRPELAAEIAEHDGGDKVHAALFAIKAAETLQLATALGFDSRLALSGEPSPSEAEGGERT